ncbi:MAG: hypothetical protein ACHQJ6_02890 [Candidatus Berkiellales bacterium]
MKSKAKTSDKKVWVEVEVNKYTDGITVFRGHMAKTDVDAWARGELIDCAIKLEKTYWFLEDQICILGKGEENVRQYTGDTYLRADTIMLIFILKDDSFPAHFSSTDNIFTFPGRTKQ